MRSGEQIIYRSFFLVVLGGFAAGCLLTSRLPEQLVPSWNLPIAFGSIAERVNSASGTAGVLRDGLIVILENYFPVIRLPLIMFFAAFTVFALPVCGFSLLWNAFLFGRFCSCVPVMNESASALLLIAAFGAAVIWLYLRIAAESALFRERTAAIPTSVLISSKQTAGYAIRFLLLSASLFALTAAAAMITLPRQ